MVRRAVLPVGAALAALGAAAPASAVVPGADGAIAFDSARDGNGEIYRMNSDGSGQTRLTNNAATEANPGWSPEGNRIVFQSNRHGTNEIFVMNGDGSGQTRLTNNAANDSNSSWSPNGQITFNSSRDGNNEIYSMNADGSGQTRLTNDANSDLRPVWSPDGTRIAFFSNRDGNDEIYVMNADGSGQTRLTNAAVSDRHPAWFSGGSALAFSRGSEIFRMNADGSGQTQLTTTNNNAEPMGSPDGNRIVFRSNRDGNDEIYVMGSDGSGQTRLTTNVASDDRPDWQALNRAPTCASETRTIDLNRPHAAEITCSDPDGNPLTYVTGNPGDGRLSDFIQPTFASAASPFLHRAAAARLTYAPNTNFLGTDRIDFTATDQRGGVATVAALNFRVVFPAQVIPEVRSFRFSPKSITVGGGSTPTAAAGGVFTYDLSAAARVQIGIERQTKGRTSRGRCKRAARRGKRCNIFKSVGTLTRNGARGVNTLAFTGRIGSKALAAGSYLATVTPFSATGEPGVPKTATFKVTAPKKKRKRR